MTTAFQPDLFQSNSFQIDGGVASGTFEVTFTVVEDGDTVSLNVGLPPNQRPGGHPKRRKTKRYIARYKDQYYQFETIADLEDFIEKARAEEADKPKKKRAPIKITLSPDFEEEIAQEMSVPRRLDAMPVTAAMAQIRRIDYTLERILADAQRRADAEEEELLMLLL